MKRYSLLNGFSLAPTVLRSRLAGLILSMLLLSPTERLATAQVSSFAPMVMSLKPTAIQVGTSAEVTVDARYNLSGTYLVLVSGSGVTAEALLPEPQTDAKPKDLTKLTIRITASAEAQTGVRELQLITPQGASTLGQLVVTAHPVVAESANNDTLETAQTFSVPATLCGALEKNEDFDFFRFPAQAGQTLTFHVQGQRLQNKIHDLQTHADPILFLKDAQGGVLAMSDNALFGDPFIAHRFDQAGEYVIELRDVRYQGNAYWQYAVEISDQPYVSSVHPLAVTAGQTTKVQPIGYFLPENCEGSVTLPENSSGLSEVVCVLNDNPGQPVQVYATALPTLLESDGDNNQTSAAVALPELPVIVNGRIEAENDLDCYQFDAKKGDRLSFEVLARRLSSELDSYLRIMTVEGKVLREVDDLTFSRTINSDSWLEDWTAPSDGAFVVEIRDVHLRGGANFPYALKITRATPEFHLIIDSAITQLRPGTSNVIYVRALKKNGFEGEIQLEIDGLPSGIQAECGRILAGKSMDGAIVLTCPPETPLGAATVVVRGFSEWKPSGDAIPLSLQATGLPYQEIYLPGGGRGHWPVQLQTVCVGQPSDLRAITLDKTDIRLKPGESQTIQVTLERAPGMEANVSLDMIYRHLGTAFADTLPPGVKLETGKSKTLLNGKAIEGTLVLTADKTAAPVERQVCAVMAHLAINFVMKSTYTGPPVFISVEPAP